MVADRQRCSARCSTSSPAPSRSSCGAGWSDRLSDLIGPATDEEHRAALVNGLLHLFGQPSPLDGIDPARTHQELIRAVLAVLAALVRRVRCTMVIADLHWASLRVLELLGGRAGPAGLERASRSSPPPARAESCRRLPARPA